MTRLEALKDICANHVLYKRIALRLTEAEFDSAVEFVEDNDHLGHQEFDQAINRMFLDKKVKPKHWTETQDLLCAANARVHCRPKHRQVS